MFDNSGKKWVILSSGPEQSPLLKLPKVVRISFGEGNKRMRGDPGSNGDRDCASGPCAFLE